MKNIYITSIPLQGRKELEKVNYIPQDGMLCAEDAVTSFPIIPVIMATQDEELENKIVVVKMKNSDTDHNLELFKQELAGIGIAEDAVSVVELEESSSYATGTNMFVQLMKEIEDNADVYACITFGTKVVSLVETFVLSSVKNIYYNTVVKGVCYGQIDRDNGAITGSRIWDVSGILSINELTASIGKLNFENPMNVLENLFKEDE